MTKTLMLATAVLALSACATVPATPPVALGAQEVTVPGPAGPLAGTLIETGTNHPAVLLLPGSGPTDRDGNNALGVKGAVYRQLAEGLQRHGITSLRIDKRGIGGSAQAVADPNKVTVADYVGDTLLWADLLKARGHRCVWLAGHSEGGLIALAATRRIDACGLILIAAPGRKLDLVLREQLGATLPAAMLAPTNGAIDKLAAGQTVDPASVPAPVRPLFAPQTQGYLIDMMKYDPTAMIAPLRLPILIVQGGEDVQVKPADAAALAKANPAATLLSLDGVNHVLKTVPKGDRVANLTSYTLDGPIAPEAIEAIAGFVNGAR